MKTNSFTHLKIWSEAHALALKVYSLTRSFPREEIYALSSQLRRSAVSIAANISEGAGRGTPKDFAHFLHIAQGSINETMYHCMLARDLGYVPAGQAEAILRNYDGLRAGVYAYVTAIKNDAATGIVRRL
ncbi:MAG TPA: four helix bundle protein [Patescibacteria group bacterium]|nr:four helix bundle protein [Patescibacteria group bacterium]